MTMTTRMTTGTITTMTDTALLTLTQWLSPSFPLGSFAYSHGLEMAIAEGKVADAAALRMWLTDTLRYGGGKTDAILLGLTLAGRDPDETADLARAIAGTSERWQETSEQGAAFVRTVAAMGGPIEPARALPVAVGVAARDLDLLPQTVISLYLHAFASNLVSAGVRFVPLGQSEGQTVLASLHTVIGEIAKMASSACEDDLLTSSFAADLASARHEDMEVRLFKT